MNIKYAIFDMDGTLLDSMYYWRNIYRYYAEFMGYSDPEISEETLRKTENMPTYTAIDYLKKHYDTEAVQSIDSMAVFDVMEKCYHDFAEPRLGVLEMLDSFKKRGVRMCVASATPTYLIEIALKKAGIREYFDFLLSPDDYPKGKTDPQIFIGAAKRFGCAINEMILFEDALYSMKTAKKLGMSVVAVKEKYELYHLDEIKKYSDILLNEFTELKI